MITSKNTRENQTMKKCYKSIFFVLTIPKTNTFPNISKNILNGNIIIIMNTDIIYGRYMGDNRWKARVSWKFQTRVSFMISRKNRSFTIFVFGSKSLSNLVSGFKGFIFVMIITRFFFCFGKLFRISNTIFKNQFPQTRNIFLRDTILFNLEIILSFNHNSFFY